MRKNLLDVGDNYDDDLRNSNDANAVGAARVAQNENQSLLSEEETGANLSESQPVDASWKGYWNRLPFKVKLNLVAAPSMMLLYTYLAKSEPGANFGASLGLQDALIDDPMMKAAIAIASLTFLKLMVQLGYDKKNMTPEQWQKSIKGNKVSLGLEVCFIVYLVGMILLNNFLFGGQSLDDLDTGSDNHNDNLLLRAQPFIDNAVGLLATIIAPLLIKTKLRPNLLNGAENLSQQVGEVLVTHKGKQLPLSKNAWNYFDGIVALDFAFGCVMGIASFILYTDGSITHDEQVNMSNVYTKLTTFVICPILAVLTFYVQWNKAVKLKENQEAQAKRNSVSLGTNHETNPEGGNSQASRSSTACVVRTSPQLVRPASTNNRTSINGNSAVAPV